MIIRTRPARVVLGRLAALLVVGLVVGLGSAVGLGAGSGFGLPGFAALAAGAAECACEQVGPYADPHPGVAPAYRRVADNLAASPNGEYEIVVGQSSSTVYRHGDRNRPLALLPTTGDIRWGFSPDGDRLLTWTLSKQISGWDLYDLSGTTGKRIAGASGLTASSLNYAFSRNGEYLLVGAVQGNQEQRVEVWDARSGGSTPLLTDSAPIVFPAYDPGGLGGESGGPSMARNVKIEIPKKTMDIEISWDAPYYQGDGEILRDGFTLDQDPIPPEESKVTQTGDRKLRLTGYRPGVKYSFQLRIVNRWGKKSAPTELSIMIPFPKPGPTPTPTPTRPGVAPEEPAAPSPAPSSSPTPSPDPSPTPSPDPSPTPSPDPSPTPSPDPSDGAPEAPTQTQTPSQDPDQTASTPSQDPAPTGAPSAPSEQTTTPAAEGGTGAATARRAVAEETTDGADASAASEREGSADPDTGTAHGGTALVDSGTTSGCGFSPDARYLLLSNQDTSGPQARIFDLKKNPKKAELVLTHRVTTPSARWFFSPCADAFGVVQLGTAFQAEAILYDIASGKAVRATAQAKASYGFTVEQTSAGLQHYFWADGKGKPLAAVTGCGTPPPPADPPVTPTDAAATAAIGRAVVEWKHPGDADAVDRFEVTPVRDGKAQDPIQVDGRQRSALVGAGDAPLPAGSYVFRIVAVTDDLRSGVVSTKAVTVREGLVCGAFASKPSTGGSAQGTATADGTRASFSYTVQGRTVTFRTPGGPAAVLDAGWWAPTTYKAGSAERKTTVTYPQWGDYLASVAVTAADGSVSIATAVVRIAPDARAANDDFAKAIVLTGSEGRIIGESGATTCEEGEPITDDQRLTQWYRHVAPEKGAFVLGEYYPTANVYAGTALRDLKAAGRSYVAYPYRTVVVPVAAGDTTMMQVAESTRAENPPGFSANWIFAATPANDDIAAAQAIAPDTALTLTGQLAAASAEPGEPSACDECSPVATSVWYRWTAASDAYIWFSSGGSKAAATLFSADPSAGAPVPSALQAVSVLAKRGGANQEGFRQVPGTEYYLQVSKDDADMALDGDSEYHVTVTPAPANDFVEDAVTLEGGSGEIAGTSRGGYVEVIPEQAYDNRWRSSMVWYEWTAPATGGVTFEVEAAREQIRQPEALVFLPGKDGADPVLHAPGKLATPLTWRTPRTSFVAEKGTRYLIAVTGLWTTAWTGPAEGDFRLHWAAATAPGAPEQLTATPVPERGAIELAWGLPSAGNADLLGYRVTADPGMPEGTVVDIDEKNRRATIYGLDPGAPYELRLAAVNAIGTGDFARVTATAPRAGLRLDPLRIEVAAGGTVEARLSANGGSAPYSFGAEGRPDWVDVDSATGTVTVDAPEQQGTVRFAGVVTDADGNSALREVVIVVGPAVEPPVAVEVPEQPAGGWYDGDVTVVLTPQDPEEPGDPGTSGDPGSAAAPGTFEDLGSADAGSAERAGGPGTAGDAESAERGAAAVAASTAAPLAPPLDVLHWTLSGAEQRSGTGSGRTAITISAEGESTLTYWRDDPRSARTLTVRIDRTGPIISVTAPADGAVYAPDQVPVAAFACTDALSGVVSCTGSTAVGETLPTAPGAHTLQVEAVDGAGHRSSTTVRYTVSEPGGEDPGPVDPGHGGNPGGNPGPGAEPAPGDGRPTGHGLPGTGGGRPDALALLGGLALLLGAGLPLHRRTRHRPR